MVTNPALCPIMHCAHVEPKVEKARRAKCNLIFICVCVCEDARIVCTCYIYMCKLMHIFIFFI